MPAPPAEYCPVSIGASLLADRWSLLIVREVMVGSHQFNAILRGLPGLSRSLLATRLRHLERLGVLARVPSETGRSHTYRLTPAGEDLHELIYALGRWTVRWWFPEPRDDQVDNALLLWRIRGGLRGPLPHPRTTLRFDFTDGKIRRGWLVVTSGETSVCLHDPGFEPDLIVRGAGRTWHEIWYGHSPLPEAITSGELTLEGPAELTRAFPQWFTLSPFAPDVAAHTSNDPAARPR